MGGTAQAKAGARLGISRVGKKGARQASGEELVKFQAAAAPAQVSLLANIE